MDRRQEPRASGHALEAAAAPELAEAEAAAALAVILFRLGTSEPNQS